MEAHLKDMQVCQCHRTSEITETTVKFSSCFSDHVAKAAAGFDLAAAEATVIPAGGKVREGPVTLRGRWD